MKISRFLFTVTLSIIICLVLLSCNSVKDPSAPTEGIIYRVSEDGKSCSVIGYEGSETDIVIAAEYEGIPVKYIANAAFESSDITSVIFPDSVTGIYYKSFYDCKSLTKIEFGSGIKEIEQYAFEGCSALEEVHIKDLKKWCALKFGYLNWNFKDPNCTSNPLKYADKLYLNGNLITDLIIPKGVNVINCYAFVGYKGLKSVTFTESVREIYPGAFANCENLETIDFGSNLSIICKFAFANCNSLQELNIPQNVTYLECYAFRNCKKLKEVHFEDKTWNFSTDSRGTNAGTPIPEDIINSPEETANLLTTWDYYFFT